MRTPLSASVRPAPSPVSMVYGVALQLERLVQLAVGLVPLGHDPQLGVLLAARHPLEMRLDTLCNSQVALVIREVLPARVGTLTLT